ncbi:DUF4065 domain-containing protein [Olsenella uli]|uniref:Panacea domain-containing protein n=1 Tax=Olsenella uli TaxID=133926 RepID=UPI00195A19D2|nr:type II toxin-antitoxin system antitoxin SocA domain-containing protein [Olsenella uli]MBM6816837.1 DUF4065 domain-containing protein [Olsenella uli]
MASIFDVAECILDISGYLSTMKLQKLAFYSNALSLVIDGIPLFPETFQAWVNGPVCPSLHSAHRGRFIVGPGAFSDYVGAAGLGERERRIVGRTLSVLGHLDGNELSELTHREAPWVEARGGCGNADRCSSVITNESIRSFYSSSECGNPLFSRS